jgi:hypothetical protein
VTSLTALEPAELARMCAERGARVVRDGHVYRVYPPDPSKRPVFFSAIRTRQGASLDTQIRDLRRAGLDLRAPVRTPPAAPPKSVPARTPVRAPSRTATAVQPEPQEDEVPQTATPDRTVVPHGPLATRKEAAELREMVRSSQDAVMGMLAQAEQQITDLKAEVARLGGEVTDLRAEVTSLRTGVKPPSKAEQVRAAVFAYFEAHPGMKLSPQLVEVNAEGTLPQGLHATAVANACKELANAGKLKGGASRDSRNRERGIYWYEPPTEDPAPAQE